ncbi:sigma factor [Micromonospora sp. DT47]
MAGDHGGAQDLVQEAYARAWRQWGKLASHPAPEAWLWLVVSRRVPDVA